MSEHLDQQLAGDTFHVGPLTLSTVLLMKDSRFPWIILVPRREDCRELTDLSRDDRMILMDEIAMASDAMQAIFGPDKMNVAALGNMVPQLHVHIIARFKSDAAWPGPVWGVGQAEAYDPVTAADRVSRLTQALVS